MARSLAPNAAGTPAGEDAVENLPTRWRTPDFAACALTAGKAVRAGDYIAVPNLLQFELNFYADATYQAPKKKPVKEDIKESHSNCLIDRSTGGCVH